MLQYQIRRVATFAGLIVLAAIASAVAARATTIAIFTNFGSDYSFDITGAYGIGATGGTTQPLSVAAMPFTAGATADLSGAILALSNTTGDSSGFTLDLESDSSGLPGTVLATLTLQGTVPSAPAPVTFDYSGTPFQLTSGTSYWLVALETNNSSEQIWFYSNSDTGTIALSDSGSATGPWTASPGSQISAFEVDGTSLATVPEPGSFQLLVLGMLCGLGALWVERRRQPSLR